MTGNRVAARRFPAAGSKRLIHCVKNDRFEGQPAIPMPKKIIICDDDEFMIHLLTVALEKHGHSVRSVATCEDIWELLEEQTPDVILMDYYVPAMGGAATVKLIREAWGDVIQIIMISAAPDVDESSLRAGANAVLIKPFRIDSLRELFSERKALVKKNR